MFKLPSYEYILFMAPLSRYNLSYVPEEVGACSSEPIAVQGYTVAMPVVEVGVVVNFEGLVED